MSAPKQADTSDDSPPVPTTGPTLLNVLTVVVLTALVAVMGLFFAIALNPNILPPSLRPATVPTIASLLTVSPGADIITYTPLPIETIAFLTAQPTTQTKVFAPDTLAPTDTETPAPPTDTPNPIGDAQVSAEGGGLNLRARPGTNENVLTTLAALTPLAIIGRIESNEWIEVITPVGDRGWVMAKFVDVFRDLDSVPITGVALDPTVTPTPTASFTATITRTGTTTPTLALTVSATNTSVPIAPYPYLSLYVSRAREIFLTGKSYGNRPNVFSKVGDSITAGPESSFLAPFGLGDYLLADHSYLQPVVNYFSQQIARENNLSWNNTSLAAANGWGSTEVLNPEKAEATICAPGESPLACEYRIVRPSVSLIMIGTNDAGGIPLDIYRVNLRQIVETSIQRGVIPVLFTLPPRNYDPGTDGRVPEFNAVIAQMASDYQIPLIDYWTPMYAAPNFGLADGVHPSEPPDGKNAHLTAGNLIYGTCIRNLLALQMLDALWRQVIAN